MNLMFPEDNDISIPKIPKGNINVKHMNEIADKVKKSSPRP